MDRYLSGCKINLQLSTETVGISFPFNVNGYSVSFGTMLAYERNNMNDISIKVATINETHVKQLHLIHAWDGEYDFSDKIILGRLAAGGSVLVQHKKTKSLELVSLIAYIDWRLEVNGCRKRVSGGQWVYAPTPHTSFYTQAKQDFHNLPQLFTA